MGGKYFRQSYRGAHCIETSHQIFCKCSVHSGTEKMCGGKLVWTAFPTARMQQSLPALYALSLKKGKGMARPKGENS